MSSNSHPHLEITLPSGKCASIVMSDGDKTTIHSPEPSPPGSTVRGRVAGQPTEFQLKVRNCVRKGNIFEIDGRVMNATRELKATLVRGGGALT